jgi:hypothetical protein
MKILNFHKINTLALFYFSLMALTAYTNSINLPHSEESTLHRKNTEDLIENIETKIQKKINLRKTKKSLKQINSTVEKNQINHKDITEEQLKYIDNFTKNQHNNDYYMYASWFIFVPLVLIIFVMTILSIAGFLILVLNSTNSNSPVDKETLLRNQISRMNRENLGNQDVIDLLRLKYRGKNKKKNHSNYKPEPEPEAILLNV